MVEDSTLRQVPIKLDGGRECCSPSSPDNRLLPRRRRQRRGGAGVGNPAGKSLASQTLHDLTYYDVRDDSPLPANLVQAARNREPEKPVKEDRRTMEERQ